MRNATVMSLVVATCLFAATSCRVPAPGAEAESSTTPTPATEAESAAVPTPATEADLAAVHVSAREADPGDVRALVGGNTAFALDLYRELGRAPGNLFFSPFSVSTALGMAYAGARTETETEMAAALRFALPQARLHPSFAALAVRIAEIEGGGKIQLRTANGLWLEKTYPFLESYVDLVTKCYGAELEPADFVRASEAARQEINGWVQGRTEGRIRDLIAPGAVNPATVAVLVNAIYFKGAWQDQFETGETTDVPFHVTPTRDVTVQMMHRTGSLGYCEDGLVQVAELPYGGRDLSMVVLLPKEPGGLAGLEAALSAERIDAWASALGMRKVELSLPKFRIETGFSLKEPLMSLGMRRAFGDADFSGMTPEGAFISQVVHKAFVDVDEKGTEAAAATAVIMLRTSVPAPEEAVVFRADHPFIFLIRDTATGSVLFMGRVAEPIAGGSE